MFGRRILVLIPHPDDEVVGCCAASEHAQAAGALLFGAYLTTGVPAADVLWPWQRSSAGAQVRRRRAEAEQAARQLGIEPVCFESVPTRKLKESLATTHALLRDLVRRLTPETLWAPAYEGGHQDHDVTNFLAGTFRGQLPVWEFSEYNFAGGRVRSQQFPVPNGTEQEIRLTREEQQRKQQALGIYASERGNLTYVQTDREVFRPLAEYDYSRPPHEGKLFYQRFQWVPFRHPRVDFTQPGEVCRAIEQFRSSNA